MALENRRKACDLCFTKKIKCDMIQPTCSNCILYKADCTTGRCRRKKAARRSSPERSPPAAPNPMEDRLSRIERQLEQLVSVTATASAAKTLTLTHSPSELQPPPEPSGIALTLPPLDDILPLLEHYFALFNRIHSLFEKAPFMRTLRRWYTDASSRTKAFWAAVHVVLALALRTPTPEALHGHGHDRFRRAGAYLKAAQSVVSELVTRDQDLLGIQVLLGVAILFQHSNDPGPASVIIGTAVRLAHRMGLNAQAHAHFYSAEENLQRQRVFWIAYALDKDISLRMKVPAVQNDVDVGLPLPEALPLDAVGIIRARSGAGAHEVNYNRLTVTLAQIEGKVYDGLLSHSATRLSADERRERVALIDGMLDQWYAGIPAAFQIPHVAASLDTIELGYMGKLYHTYLLLLTVVYGLYGQDAAWVNTIRSGSGTVIKALADSMADEGANHPSGRDASRRPWDKCVGVSRACLLLFWSCVPTECLVWHCMCPNFSGMILLLANILADPTHEHAAADMELADKALDMFDRLIGYLTEPMPYREIRAIAGQLREKAATAMQAEDDAFLAVDYVHDWTWDGFDPAFLGTMVQ